MFLRSLISYSSLLAKLASYMYFLATSEKQEQVANTTLTLVGVLLELNIQVRVKFSRSNSADPDSLSIPNFSQANSC